MLAMRRVAERRFGERNRVAVIAICIFVSTSTLFASRSGSDISQHTRDLHFRSIVFDTHDDTTQRLIYQHYDIGTRHTDGSIDIPRMREGGLNAIFFAIWIPGTTTGAEAAKQTLDQIAVVRKMIASNTKDLAFCRTADEVRRTRVSDRISVLIGVEGGHMIANDLALLRTYAEIGVRYMTLTHMVNNEWADSSTDKPVHNGLTDFGREVVREMNRLGIMVDISHVSDKTFYDAFAVSQAPVIASHSSCRVLCNAPRNMSDDMIRALGAKGGVVQINYHVGFLSQEFLDASRDNADLIGSQEAEVDKQCGIDEACKVIEGDKLTRRLVVKGKLPRVSWEKIIEHIDHVAKLVGVDHVGLGSDFDGADMPFGMEDVSQLPKITDGLLKKGYSDSDVQKILGGNTMRVMEQVEATARRLGREL